MPQSTLLEHFKGELLVELVKYLLLLSDETEHLPMLLGLFVDLPVLDAGQGSIDHILPEAHDLRDGLLEH